MTFPVPVPTPLEAGVSHDFLRNIAPELAKDIVLQIGGARELAVGHYGLSELQWDALKHWPGFRQLLANANEELAGAVGLNERIRRQARYALATGGIAQLAGVMSNPKTPPQHLIKAGEALADIAGVTAKVTSAGGAVIAAGGALVSIQFSNDRPVKVGVNAPIEGEAKRVEADHGA